MAKINIQFEHGDNSISLQLSGSLDRMRGAITDAMNLVLSPEVAKYDVVVGNPSINKVPNIKAVRTVTGLGLKEAKELVDSLEFNFSKILPATVESKDVESVRNTLEPCFGYVKFNEK